MKAILLCWGGKKAKYPLTYSWYLCILILKTIVQREYLNMKNIVSFSEAASLGMHAMVLLAENPEVFMCTEQIAKEIGGSKHHLAKVIGRLSQAGLVESMSGPKGGVKLAKKPEEITYMDIFQAIEGPVSNSNCFLGRQYCRRKDCIFLDIRDELFTRIKEYFRVTTLGDFLNRNTKESND
ncbi:MAG TPA: Rrf2 family transcriptional regulator [candidate division Zixibacteria bacterium]|nr:Rrf2 family transcriptional regulator [candidate division Zixibacteria bacterium]